MEYTPRYKTRNEDERYLATVAWLSCGNPKKKKQKTKPPQYENP